MAYPCPFLLKRQQTRETNKQVPDKHKQDKQPDTKQAINT